jgi:hypothetical protein
MNNFIDFVEKCKQFSFLQIFTIFLRYLIGGGFVIAAFGMGKFSGQELLISHAGAPIETLEPLQQFFRIMSTSGLYWQFIGFSQVIGGGLLMTQRFAKLGAVIFFALILNIFVITIAFNFKGTPMVTGLMLLATTFLILWDINSFQFIFRSPVKENLNPSLTLAVLDHPFWTGTGTFMLATIVALAFMKINSALQMGIVFIEGLLAFCIYIFSLRKGMRINNVHQYKV